MTKENQKLKIGILGKEKEIIFFKALGFEIFPIDEGFKKAIESIEKREDLAIIFVPFHIFSKIKMEKFYQKKYPVFVSLPFKGEKKEPRELKEISKMAIGKEKI